jgi:N utilization substance protein B
MSMAKQAALSSRRGSARLAAVQALYQLDLSPSAVDGVIAEFVAERLGKEIEGDRYRQADAHWFAEVVRGCSQRMADIDRELAALMTREQAIQRLEPLLRATLRAAAFELMARADVPARVAIDEYMEVARAFFGPSESALVNGVLDKLARKLRPGELEPAKSE